MPQGKFVVIYKVKARDHEWENKESHQSGGQEGLRQRSGRGYQKTSHGDDEFDGGDDEFEEAHAEDIVFYSVCVEEIAARARFSEGKAHGWIKNGTTNDHE